MAFFNAHSITINDSFNNVDGEIRLTDRSFHMTNLDSFNTIINSGVGHYRVDSPQSISEILMLLSYFMFIATLMMDFS